MNQMLDRVLHVNAHIHIFELLMYNINITKQQNQLSWTNEKKILFLTTFDVIFFLVDVSKFHFMLSNFTQGSNKHQANRTKLNKHIFCRFFLISSSTFSFSAHFFYNFFFNSWIVKKSHILFYFSFLFSKLFVFIRFQRQKWKWQKKK